MSGYNGTRPSHWKMKPAQVEWAYRKWCEGHSKCQIAKALGVDLHTVMNHLRGREFIEIPLVYEEETLRALLVRPRELAVEVNIPNTLEALQEAVGGYIEVVEAAGCALIVDEEGLLKGLEHNLSFEQKYQQYHLFGNILIVGIDGEEFCDLTDFEVEQWESLINFGEGRK